MYVELINLLSCSELEAHECKEMAERVLNAPDDPEYEWVIEVPDSVPMACELVQQLWDFAAVSDKIDEVHEQIQEMFDDEFPDIPDRFSIPGGWNIDAVAYLKWLDAELAKRGLDQGGYEAIMLDTHADDRMTMFIVYRKDGDRILQLASELDLTMYRPQEKFQ
ncbi:hypothetical protein [Massilia sp. TN1-12]|uniref:hypothetical protein n=1 Tax=Massilia paldalensis TaxID=3377675 RepID=UPI00384E6EED